jgi:hypothetical protein
MLMMSDYYITLFYELKFCAIILLYSLSLNFHFIYSNHIYIITHNIDYIDSEP